MNITYDYYRIFCYVAKYRSFTQAANALYSSQPNVTRAIKNLENELGCTLFIRSNRSVELTPEGEKLFSRVSVAFEYIQAAEEELSFANNMKSGLITISVTEIALHCHVLKVLKKFHQAYPDVHIRLTNHSTPQALKALKDNLADIAIVTSPTGVMPPLTETPIKSIKAAAVCSSYFSELANRKISWKELSHYPIVMLGSHAKSHDFY
ncbi:MAG: LysR family transcriptional regulator, partial [Clostridia bacterium]|nr:LysR family transcriptional regulator [Clostridia bacterium]